MKKTTVLICALIGFAINITLAQTSLTPDVSPNAYIETPTYSEEYINGLLQRIVDLEIHTSSLEARVFELERYLNAYTASSTSAATQQNTQQSPTAQNTVQQTQPATTQQQDTVQPTTTQQQDTVQPATTQQSTAQQQTGTSDSSNSSYPADSYYLQVGAYNRSDLGLQQKQRLEQYGYTVYESADGNIYRLYLGPFANSEIDGIQASLRELGIDSFPVR